MRTVADESLVSAEDSAILSRAHALGRAVVTEDADFGMLAIRDRQPFIGLIYIRPGDLRPSHVLELFESLARGQTEVVPPFIVVAQRKGGTIRIRFRSRVDL